MFIYFGKHHFVEVVMTSLWFRLVQFLLEVTTYIDHQASLM